MPCYDPRDRSEADDARNDLAKVEAMLCAVLTRAASMGGLHSALGINERESGISQDELLEWWAEHQRKDKKQPPGVNRTVENVKDE